MTISSSTFSNVNVGTEPNDGTGDPLRTSFTKINENFQYVTDTIWPDIQISRLFTDITSGYISAFNLITADTVQANVIGNVEATIIANNITAENFSTVVFSANTFVTSSIESNIVQANTAIAGNISVSSNTTTNGLTVNASAIVGSSLRAIAGIQNTVIGNVTPAAGTFTDLYATNSITSSGNITLNGTSNTISGFGWLVQSARVAPTLLTGNTNISLSPSPTTRQFTAIDIGDSTSFTVNLSYSSVTAGCERIFVFKNNASSLSERYILLPTAFNNKGTSNIIVSSTGNVFMHFIPFDDTVTNVYVMVANT